jgi:hypothetical protein
MQAMNQEAVAHAHLAERSGELTWKHIESEYTQDVDQIAATLATGVPLAWTLARELDDDGSLHFLVGTTVDEIREQYRGLRSVLEINKWRAVLEIRQGWYTLTQGVCSMKVVPTGQLGAGETVALFPIGADGILGELQTGAVGRYTDGSVPSDNGAVPEKRLAVLAGHDAYVEALRAQDVDTLVAAHSPKSATAIRNYLTDESSLLNITGLDPLRGYFSELFQRYRVLDVRLVNRVAEAWYAFAELHWIVEERTGAGRTLEFCTAELSPLDEAGRYWVRTGAGTDPVEA